MMISHSTPGNLNISGDEFIEAQYNYTRAHLCKLLSWVPPEPESELKLEIVQLAVWN